MTGTVTGKANFFSSGDIQTSEQQAVPIAAQDLSVQLTSVISEGW